MLAIINVNKQRTVTGFGFVFPPLSLWQQQKQQRRSLPLPLRGQLSRSPGETEDRVILEREDSDKRGRVGQGDDDDWLVSSCSPPQTLEQKTKKHLDFIALTTNQSARKIFRNSPE